MLCCVSAYFVCRLFSGSIHACTYAITHTYTLLQQFVADMWVRVFFVSGRTRLVNGAENATDCVSISNIYSRAVRFCMRSNTRNFDAVVDDSNAVDKALIQTHMGTKRIN